MNVEIANKLVELRKKKGLSQEDLAEKIGVSRQAVSKWERAESSPDTDNLIALSKIYKISIDKMIDGNAKVVSPEVILNNTTYEERIKYYFKPDPKIIVWISALSIFISIIYLMLGFAFELWHPYWVIFQSLPVCYMLSVIAKFNKKKKDRMSIEMKVFPVPLLIFAFFVILNSQTGSELSWLVFLAIPFWAVFISRK